MFIVKWVARFREHTPVETEESILTDLDDIVRSCKERLYGIRLRYVATPPDGFIVCDEGGKELRRWLGPIAPQS